MLYKVVSPLPPGSMLLPTWNPEHDSTQNDEDLAINV